MGSCCDNNAENISMVEKNITTNLINVQNNLQANQTGLQEQINENKTEYIENKYVCGLNTHFHTKSPLVTSHHDSYSNAIKLENNMLLTAAHNVTEVQLRNPIQGLELGATLPDNSVHDVSGFGTDRGSTGDSSTVVITDKITGQKREILCNQYRYGTAFYDITNGTELVMLLKFFPGQNARSNRRNVHNQNASSSVTGYSYSQHGEARGSYTTPPPFALRVFDLNNANNGEIRDCGYKYIYWDLENIGMKLVADDLIKYKKKESIDDLGKYFYNSCHNIKVHEKRLYVVGAMQVLTTQSSSDSKNGSIMVFNIDPDLSYSSDYHIEEYRNKSYAEQPYFMSFLLANKTMPCMTEEEITMMHEDTLFVDNHQKLTVPLDDPSRPTITLSEFCGNGEKREMTNHDLNISTIDGKLLISTGKGSGGIYGDVVDGNPPDAYYYYYTFGKDIIIDATEFEDYVIERDLAYVSSPGTLTPPKVKIYYMPLDPLQKGIFYGNNLYDLGYPHDNLISPSGKYLIVNSETPDYIFWGNFPGPEPFRSRLYITMFDIQEAFSGELTTLIDGQLVLKQPTPKQITDYSAQRWYKGVNGLTGAGSEGVNIHNLNIKQMKDSDGNLVDILAQAGYVDGIYLFNVTDIEDVKLIGYSNILENTYRTALPDNRSNFTSYTFQKDQTQSLYTSSWGCNFLKLTDDLFVSDKIMSSVFKLTNLNTDIRTLENSATKQKFSFYPTIANGAKINLYDSYNNKYFNAKIKHIDQLLDIAILEPIDYTLTEFVNLDNTSLNKLDKVNLIGNIGKFEEVNNKGVITNINGSTSPYLLTRKSYGAQLSEISNGYIDVVNDVHSSIDVAGLISNDKKNIIAAHLVRLLLSDLTCDLKCSLGCSGSGVFSDSGDFIGMVTQMFTNSKSACVISAKTLKNVIDIVTGKKEISYLGLKLTQNINYFVDGYLVDAAHSNGPSNELNNLIKTKEEETPLEENQSIVAILSHVHEDDLKVRVGPNEKSISVVQIEHKPEDKLKMSFNMYIKTQMPTMVMYELLDTDNDLEITLGSYPKVNYGDFVTDSGDIEWFVANKSNLMN